MGQTAARTQEAAVKEAIGQERGLSLAATRQLPAAPGLLPHATATTLPWRRGSSLWGGGSEQAGFEPCSLPSGLHTNPLSGVSLFPPPLPCPHECAAIRSDARLSSGGIVATPFGGFSSPPSVESRTVPYDGDLPWHLDASRASWGSYKSAPALHEAQGSLGKSPCSAIWSEPNPSGKSLSSVESSAGDSVPFLSYPGPSTRRACFGDMSSETSSSQFGPLGGSSFQHGAGPVPVGPLSRQQGFACLRSSLELAVAQKGLAARPPVPSLYNSPMKHVLSTSLASGGWNRPTGPASPADADGCESATTTPYYL